MSRKTSSRSSRSSRTAGGDGKRHHKKRDKNARLYALDKSNPSSGGGDPSAPGALAKDDKKKPTRWWLWALVAILVIVVIIGVVVAGSLLTLSCRSPRRLLTLTSRSHALLEEEGLDRPFHDELDCRQLDSRRG